jgi:hypothetical protein
VVALWARASKPASAGRSTSPRRCSPPAAPRAAPGCRAASRCPARPRAARACIRPGRPARACDGRPGHASAAPIQHIGIDRVDPGGMGAGWPCSSSARSASIIGLRWASQPVLGSQARHPDHARRRSSSPPPSGAGCARPGRRGSRPAPCMTGPSRTVSNMPMKRAMAWDSDSGSGWSKTAAGLAPAASVRACAMRARRSSGNGPR